eukprot:m.28663 g.28663  ORF g.28663 m.28663 type:complete len:96 (+) comp30922_c0_seq7:1187-1474(+)
MSWLFWIVIIRPQEGNLFLADMTRAFAYFLLTRVIAGRFITQSGCRGSSVYNGVLTASLFCQGVKKLISEFGKLRHQRNLELYESDLWHIFYGKE